MILKDLKKTLRDNEFVTIQMYNLIDELTSHIDFERRDDLFETTIGDWSYELMDLFGDCNVDAIEPVLFNDNLCINIILREDTDITYKILTELGYN